MRRRLHPGRRGHVRDRHEPELHERLRHRLPVLRLLPEAGRPRGLHPHRRRGHGQDRRGRRAGRDHRPPPGRAQPVPAPRLLPRSRPRDPAALPGRAAPLLHRVRDPDDGPGLHASRQRGAGAAPGRGSADPAGRRRRDPLRARPPPHRPEEGRPGQLAGGPPGGAPARAPVDGHHDVRPRRGAGGRPGPPGRRARPPGRDRGLHGVRPLVLQAGQHAAGEVDQALRRAQRLLPDAGAVALLPGQHAPRAGVLVLGGEAGRADRAPLRGRRLGRNALRGERPQGGGLRQQDHGRRDRGPDPGGRLPARPADHALRAGQGLLGQPRAGRLERVVHDVRSAGAAAREDRAGASRRAAARSTASRYRVSSARRPSSPSVTV